MKEKSENRTCQNCKNDFTIESDDFGFYEKIKVPAPTFCPDCRRQRRWAWRNNMSLYNRKCELCDKAVVSIYSPDSGLTIYCNKCWWSDKWDSKSYGVDYDFSKSFFVQFNELMKKVPHMAIVNDDGIASVNCEYTHDWWFSKNCYMSFSGWYVENVLYSFYINAGKDMMDCMNVLSKTENMYGCVNCGHSYKLKYSQFCKECVDSAFLYDCKNCIDCLMCVGLVNKKYCFKNQQYEREEYLEILKSYNLHTFSGAERAQKEYDEFVLTQKHRHSWTLNNNQNVTGDVIGHSKNTKNSYMIRSMENCSFCDFCVRDKDSYDLTLSGELSECYEGVVVDHSQLNLWGIFSVKSQDIRYTQHCHNCKYVFGCVGLRDASYCIFNKQYTKEEYEKLIPKIIEQMNTNLYVDKKENVYKYGEFFPIELSPFGYNESCAMENFILSKEEALANGFSWQDNTQKTTGKETLKFKDIPDDINNVKDSILNEVLSCIECERNFKIIPNELIFYRKLQIPLARKCFSCRHNNRIKKHRNPFKLWHRKCMKEGCSNEFETSYSPDRPEIVFCEKCYQQEVY